MVFTCKVPSCDRRDTSGMYTFPTKSQPDALRNWKLALKIPESQAISPNWRVCYKHFPTEKIEAKVKLEYSLLDKDGKLPRSPISSFQERSSNL